MLTSNYDRTSEHCCSGPEASDVSDTVLAAKRTAGPRVLEDLPCHTKH